MRVCLIFLAHAATLQVQVSPVQKVIELLDQLKGKVAAELENEETMMSEYTEWCASTQNEREDAITSAERTSTDLAATIQENNAAILSLKSEVEELATKISAADSDLSAATEIRNKERADFEAREKELVETVDTLERAVIVLKRGQTNFLQKGTSKDMSMLADSLSKIVAATWVDSHQRDVVQSLLQSEDGDADEDLALQPQASVKAYESKGGSIIETLQDMQTKAEASLSDARRSEMEEKHAFEMLKQSLTTELETMNDRKNEATSSRANSEEQVGAAQGSLDETQAGLKSDTKYLKELKLSCASKVSEWETRQKEAAEEMAAIAKAKEILMDGVKAFFQAGVKATRGGVVNAAKSKEAQDDVKRGHLTDVLRQLASANKDAPGAFELSQLASSAQNDPFGKVRELIESMVERLLKEAGEEADAKAFCDTETKKSKAKQEQLSAQADQHAVRIEKASAGKAKLAQQVKQLQEEVAAIDAQNAEATKLRSQEKSDYDSASAEYKQAAEAIANAMQVLQEYYSQGSFLQTQARQAPELGGAKTDVASTILEMLEVAESDFTRLVAEEESAENAAVNTYEKLTQDNKVAKATKLEEIKGKSAEQKSLELHLLNYKEDGRSTAKELDAVLEYLDKLKPQCETKVMSFAERTARREQEIAGLKEALTILEA